MTRRRRSIAGWVTFAFFAAGGSALASVGAREWWLQERLLANAQPIEVTIVRSEVRAHTSADTDRRSLRDNSTTTYRPDISFAYVIDGHSYVSDQLHATAIVTSCGNEATAAAELVPFPVGARVPGWVDREYPERAFLHRDPSSAPAVFVVVGLTVTLLAWWLSRFV